MIILFILFSAKTICYAGDIPESLLSNNNTQVYFGEVKSLDGDTITVIQRKNIKGEFAKNSETTYTKFAFTHSPEIGKQYLCGFYDDSNPLYIWEVTSLNTNTLKIKNNDDMSQRMQEYLNSGKFEEKEQERLLSIEASKATMTPIEENSTVQPTDIGMQMQNKTTTNISYRSAIYIWIFFGFIAIVLSILFIKKRKH